MAKLYGRDWTRAQIADMTGGLSQITGVRFSELTDAAERGVRIAECRTGGGLSFTVVLDCGMDVGAATYLWVRNCCQIVICSAILRPRETCRGARNAKARLSLWPVDMRWGQGDAGWGGGSWKSRYYPSVRSAR